MNATNAMDEIAGIPNAEHGLDPSGMLDAASAEEAPLSRVERLAVRLGAWAGGVAERWAFSSGPFFAFDGRPIALCAPYDDCQPTTPDA